MGTYFTSEQLEELTKSLSLSSINRYAQWLKNIQPVFNLEELEKTPKEYIRKANNQKANTSVLAVLNKIIQTFSKNGKAKEAYEEAYNKVKFNPSTSANRPATDKEKEKQISYDDLINKRKELDAQWDMLDRDEQRNQTNVRLAIQRLVLTLYTELPPQRAEVYLDTTYGYTEGHNYISFSQVNQIIVVRGKRMKGRENIILDLSDSLVKAMLDVRKITKSDWLLPKISDFKNPMKTSGFNLFMKSIFGKNVGSSTLRNVVVSHMLDIGTSKEDMDKLAVQMNHSSSTQRAIYTKYSNKLHGDDNETIKKLQEENKQLKNKLSTLEEKIDMLLSMK